MNPLDLAAWALGGGAANDDSSNENEGQHLSGSTDEQQLSPEEIRRQRLERLAAVAPQPMQVDTPDPSPPNKKKEETKKSEIVQTPIVAAPSPEKPKKKVKPEHSPADNARKILRKKELMLKKVLSIAIQGSSTCDDHTVTVIDSHINDITPDSITEILAARFDMEFKAKSLLQYLGESHRKASEEMKTLQQVTKQNDPEIMEILQEIQTQTVNYAGSCLVEPSLFRGSQDSRAQLAKCLIQTSMDISTSITFGVNGQSSSFYHALIDELLKQDQESLRAIVTEITETLLSKLNKCESITDTVEEGGPVVIISALTALVSHKQVADMVTQLPSFLLPLAGSSEANQQVQPPLPAGLELFRRMAMGSPPYKKRSGPGLDKHTFLGLVLRIGAPQNNSAFAPQSILRQPVTAIETATSSQRQQLKVMHEAAFQLTLALIKGGPAARARVMLWFSDALKVNTGASAMRPDPAKVSAPSTLLNMTVILLKLCQPFVTDEKKHALINPGFLSSPEDHQGVFETTGDDAVARLGEVSAESMDTYNPKNSFIPQCFFLCARVLHLGLVPQLFSHKNLLRHISYLHHDITNGGGGLSELQANPRFAQFISKQRSDEVALFQEELVVDTLVFCNLVAKFLNSLDDDTLLRMPEDFVSDTCDILTNIARLKAKLLRGVEVRYVFKLVVKMLSDKYKDVVRNYNLRAKLGDVLHDIFLPSDSNDPRDVPSSVACDPLAGGQTYLLSDTTAQETLAPSLLLLYGDVEKTGYYDKMSHRAKIADLIKFLWENPEHRPAFRRITQNTESFITFANGIMNETNLLIATVMQKLPEIREIQLQMRDNQAWGQLTEEQQTQISERLSDSENEVTHALPLCNKTLQMFGYLNTDSDIRRLFLLDELCPRLVSMLTHVLTRLIGSKGMELKVDNPEQYQFRPKEMLRDLCAIFALFTPSAIFQKECVKADCKPTLLHSAVKTCSKLHLLTGESLKAFESLPDAVQAAESTVMAEEALYEDAPDEFLDPLMQSFMHDPVILPSKTIVDRSTIMQHLLNDSTDPFNREPMTKDDLIPAVELKARMESWLKQKSISPK